MLIYGKDLYEEPYAGNPHVRFCEGLNILSLNKCERRE